MKNRLWKQVMVSGLLLVLLTHTAMALDLYPKSLKDRRGESSDQPLSVLSRLDQSGNQDNWNRYVEFSPGRRGYKGVFYFRLPRDVDAATVDTLTLSLNYRGPARSEQRWRWLIRNFKHRRWVPLGENKWARDWIWFNKEFPVSGAPSNYINDDGRLKVRYVSYNNTDNSQLDYLKLSLGTESAPTPPGEPLPPEPLPPGEPSPPGIPIPPSEPVPPQPLPPGEVWQPAPGTSWVWQLSGTVDMAHDVAMYDIDLFDVPQQTIDQLHTDGRVVICYFSAGSWENWRPDADQYPQEIKGRSNGWPGEKWLDIRRIDLLAPILEARLDMAKNKGCKGVEPDNIDGYTNQTGFPLTAEDQLAFNRWLSEQAHARGLSIGLKNDMEQVEILEPWFDWALNEQCFQYNECELLLPFIQAGKAVFGVEYQGNPDVYCPKANAMGFDWLKKSLNLGTEHFSCRESY